MKKLISLFFLFGIAMSAFAQKSYVHIHAESLSSGYEKITLSGNIPKSIAYTYGEGTSRQISIGNLLNLLSKEGFELEFMSGAGSNCFYVLSKKNTDSSEIIQYTKTNDDSDIHEVARYNLQGMPIGKNEKGVQIVVYSNYTTKTIIKE